MKIIKPFVELIDEVDSLSIFRKLEACGRICYKSEGRITQETAEPFIAGLIRRGHESVLEHVSITMKVICDRAVANEIVRHRIASYSQESTRYCNYGRDDFGSEITVIEPNYLEQGTAAYFDWHQGCLMAEKSYFSMLSADCTAQEARAVLPCSLKTELAMTMNLREWRHYLKLRTGPGAHPQMRQVALMQLNILQRKLPVIFTSI